MRRLRDYLTIESRVINQGTHGFPKNEWTETLGRSCDIFPIDAKEFYSGDSEVNEVRYRIRFRYEPNLIKTGYRLIDKRVSPHRVFDVEGVINKNNLDREIICKCVERT